MKLNHLLAALIAAPLLGLAGGALAEVPNKDPLAKQAREATLKDAEGQYKADAQACEALSGNTKDICLVDAKGRVSVARANAEAKFENTAKNRETVRVASADAVWGIAKERCDNSVGTAKDVCVTEADAAHVKALADAKVDRVTSEGKQEVSEKTMEVRKDATEKTVETRKDAANKTAAIREDAAQKTAVARQDAANQKRDADYKVAAEKCEALAGTAKDGCVRDAKTRYGKL